MSIFNVIESERLKRERDERYFTHEKFIDIFLNLVENKPERFIGDIYEADYDNPTVVLRNAAMKVTKPVEYEGQTVTICPEAITFIDIFNDYSHDQDKCKSMFRQLIDGSIKVQEAEFKEVVLDQSPSEGIWFNETNKGVNLRPGLENGEQSKVSSIHLGDQNVHSLIVGRTGSGKSVFLNNIIFNLLTEYAPWELDLYLADFKKVELSRYMTKYETPHLKAVAATSEIRYVITMLDYLVECMQARQDLFTRLGTQKLSEFRSKFNVVLPRVVLIVDEFQQMFQEATYSEGEKIRDLLTSITKLGRATGFHLIFASQDMSGSLSSRVMSNFKVRFALPSEASISSDILGNSAAANLELGYVLANTESGKIEDNIKFRVPFINDDEVSNEDGTFEDSYFYQKLKQLQLESEKFDFTKQKNFYQEDLQLAIESLDELLSKITANRENITNNSQKQFFDVFTLGRGVVYSNKKFDLETFFIEYGLNKNILAVSTDIDDVAYTQNLLSLNFKHTPHKTIQHIYYNFNPMISAKINIAKNIKLNKVYDNEEDLNNLHKKYLSRKGISEAYGSETLAQFLEIFTSVLSSARGDKAEYELYKNTILELYKEVDIADYRKYSDDLISMGKVDRGLIEPLIYFHDSYLNGFVGKPAFPQFVYWISSVDYIEKLPRWYSEVLKNAMTMDLMVINFSTSDEINSDLISRSEYVFISGNNERLYNRCGINFTKKNRNSIVIDFKIRSLNTERAFKKYKIKANNFEVPSLNFDKILL